ncbi:hydroxymethylbilane synthase [Luteirhabdus pelagi]|uniref:hydroxymethylbilane synthase n=1 Tax=Luteirhabdus pelagi TaxID=2792783 RepID=UPI00193A9F5C|nr:hydroxymethylbilane synthase [Luteirhabdus pelagi]
MNKTIRIGTRDSQLALWQAKTVQSQLENHGYKTKLVPVKSTGDLVLDTPLYEMGITGIFTKTLDVAMIKGDVDIAVHSMKDVPTMLPKGIIQTAVLERAATDDILATKGDIDYEKPCTIATGSLRRKAQWLHRYPHHSVVDLRGNVNTRLQKLQDNDWQGAIFAKAGLERIDVLPDTYEALDWMIPAPAQGAMVVVAMENDTFSVEATQKLNDLKTDICTKIERDFLRTLEGGCTAPIGALAEVVGNSIQFRGCLFSLDGQTKLEAAKEISIPNPQGLEHPVRLSAGKDAALELLENGGAELMASIKSEMNK